MVEDKVVRYVREVYDNFKQQRQDQEEIWDLAYDAFMGRYSEANLSKWKALEGHDWRSKVFVRFARRKVISQVSQINDIQFQGGQLPFNITPTEVPESMQGQLLPPQIAQARCRDMKQLIQDTLEEQKYDRTLMASNLEAGIYGMSVHKAPVIRRKQSVNYQMWIPPAARMMDSVFGTRMAGKYGRMQRNENVIMLPFVEHINLWDYFWDMEAADHQSGIGNIHRVMMDAGMLRRLEELPGYDKAAISRVLSGWNESEGGGSAPDEGPGAERLKRRRRTLEVVEFWGLCPKRHLKDNDRVLSQATTDGRETEICTTIVYSGGNKTDGVVIKQAEANPLPLKRRPFHVAYWEGVPHETIGVGIPENIQDSQMMINGFWRCFIDNAALSGNLVRFYKSSAFKPGQDMNIRPGAGYELEDWVTDVRQAVNWVSPPYIGTGMIEALNVAERLGDEESGHPKLMQGEMAKHMPQTAFQTSQLLEAANKQTGNIIKNIDEGHIEPDVEAFYHFLMETHPNENIKGDYCVQATGFSAYNDRVIKGKAVQSLFGLAMSNERTAMLIKVGPNLREIYRLSDLDPDQFMLSEEEEAQMNQQAAMMAEQAALMPPPGREGEIPMGQGGPQGPGQEQAMGRSMVAIPGRAGGGAVRAGKPYVVGEDGPEVIVPETDGTVIPLEEEAVQYGYTDPETGERVGFSRGFREEEPQYGYTDPETGERVGFRR